jgi:hypothetical protein
LTAKVYSVPPSVDKLSELFQEFYVQAAANIATHIQSLSTRQYRDPSPALSVSSRISVHTNRSATLRSKASKDKIALSEKSIPEQQMLTPNEVSERRKARRLLEQKRTALEEAVERRVCEAIYDRIWRHRSTLDEVRDEKLRSRTAALALVGINLKDLGIDFDGSTSPDVSPAALASQVEEWIAKARECLLQMNDSHSPFGKLQCLALTHKHIVDLLTKLHQSSSSADEILPTLIYTLITSPPESLNVISNLHYIQRFRSASKINGEAAYCLTNLEAAITFLETVDLASLRADEALEGPAKSSSRPTTPRAETPSPWSPGLPTSAGLSSPATTPLTAVPTSLSSLPSSHPLRSPLNAKPSLPASPAHERRLSNIFQPPARAIGAASDVVRTTADTGFRNISSTLDSSFKLLFGRLKEQHIQGDGTTSNGTIIVPKTLDDARKLVSPRPLLDEEGNISEASSFADQPEDPLDNPSPKADDRLLDLVGGRKPMPRDRSADSNLSNGSNGRRVGLTAETRAAKESSISPNLPSPAPSITSINSMPNAAVESMRSLGNTLNPLNRLAGMNVMRGFGRGPTSTPTPVAKPVSAVLPPSVEGDRSPAKSFAELDMEPPIRRFVEMASVEKLSIGEVGELLRDYQRLAGVLKAMGAY